MSASIKATCPGCRKLIRIPLDWSERAMKCKKCGTLVQMKKKDAPPSSASTETALAPPAPTAATPVYEPNYDAPPTPAYSYPVPPPVPAYAHYPEPPVQPYGYPQPYPMPQYPAPQPPGYGYAYPQPPGYGYPQPPGFPPPGYGYPAAPPPAPEAAFPTNDDLDRPRSTYNRGHGGNTQKIVLSAIVAVLIVGLVALGMKIQSQFNENPVKPGETKPAIPNHADTTAPIVPGVTPAVVPAIVSDPFPRRLLFIHVSKYVFFNSLAPGVFGRGEDMPTRTAGQMAYEFRVPTDAANNQLFVMSDTGKATAPPLKSVLTQTFDQFFASSRDQDRIVVYFSGHAREIDGKAYLVPVDGDPEEVTTLIPLDEIYAKLAACKAQQKVLLFDVCRFNPGYGAARAGSEPMSEKLAELLHAVPPGVQVLTSCSAGQNAQETSETGSEFLTAFRAKAKELKAISAQAKPDQPILIDKWADALRECLAGKREHASSQTVKATVPVQDAASAVAYRKEDPPAAHFAWPVAPASASAGEVNKLLQLAELPGIRKEIEIPAGLGAVYPFSAEIMKGYIPDVPDEESIKGNKYPLRKATNDALNYIREHWKFGSGDGLRETLNGSVDETLKKQIAADQFPIAKLTLELDEQLNALLQAGKALGSEKSKRWQALYTYALAQIQMRWAFVHEYNLALGNIRTDNLEKPAGGGTPIYRLVSVEKMKSNKEIAGKVESAREAFEKIIKDHKGTPLEVLAKMNKNVSLGLTWKLEVAPEAMAEDKAEKKE